MKLLKYIIIALVLLCSSGFAVGLADGAAKFVGNITTNGQVRSDFGQYWNQITAENECKWASIEGSRGNYNWRGCDAAYNWAKQNNAHFKFHALVWGSQYPNWLNGLSVDETKKAITAWFDAVKNHYPDLEMIDVVNEAIKSGGSYHSGYGNGNNIIGALGGDNGNYEFVVTAFKMARERWPDAILIYNDYNTVQWQKNEGIDLINKIKKAGAPVDAYGLQAHDMQKAGGGNGGTGGGGTCLDINQLKSAIEEIWTKTQMPMFISEYDIASDDDNDQKNCYSQQISYFMENEHIAGITLWGYIYGSTWTTNGNSGIIKNGQDRPAMTWLKQYLAENKGVNSTGLPTGDGVTIVEPEPQKPFKGKAFDLTAPIEAEDFDIPGKGAGNNSYLVSGDCDDVWNTTYRSGTSVKIGDKNGGMVIGCNATGNYYQYTIKVPEAGNYIVYATVAADGEGAILFKVGDKAVSDTMKFTGDSWSKFDKIKGHATFSSDGEQILTLEIAQGYIDVDNFEFAVTDCAPGDVTCGGPSYNCDAYPDDPMCKTVDFDFRLAEQKVLKLWSAFDANGKWMGNVSAYTADDAIRFMKLKPGLYIIKANGKWQTVIK
jgi:GH35 family endo-1,4-beta-xylanase